MDTLASEIDSERIQQLAHSCIERPNTRAIDCLKACHQSLSLQQRVEQMGYPRFPQDDRSTFTIGGSEWGVVINFQRKNQYWWSIQGIYEVSLWHQI